MGQSKSNVLNVIVYMHSFNYYTQFAMWHYQTDLHSFRWLVSQVNLSASFKYRIQPVEYNENIHTLAELVMTEHLKQLAKYLFLCSGFLIIKLSSVAVMPMADRNLPSLIISTTLTRLMSEAARSCGITMGQRVSKIWDPFSIFWPMTPVTFSLFVMHLRSWWCT